MHSVIATSDFETDAKSAGLSEDEITSIVIWLAEHPLAGDLMPGTGGARKVRFAAPVSERAAAIARFTTTQDPTCHCSCWR